MKKIKKNYFELGIPIDDVVLSIFEKAVQLEGRQSKLARALGIPEATLSIWMKKTQKETASISWDLWRNVRTYLVRAELIDAEDPRWMLPSQMRERLMAIRGDSDVTARQSAVNTGTVNGSMTVNNNQGRADAAELKSSIRMALIKAEGMCADCKLKAIAVIESV